MATAEPAPRLAIRRRPPASQISLWVFGAVLLLGLGYWLVKSFVEDPSRFTEVTLIGFTNGSIYALVALGYTLVYGIIELINFAHGDNFMLGTFQTHSIVHDGSFQIPLLFGVLALPLGTATVAASSGWHRAYAVAACVLFAMLFCAAINVSIEWIGYRPLRNQPRLAPLITAIGFSFILQNIGLAWKKPGPVPMPDILPKGVIFDWKGIDYSYKDFIVIAITIPLLVALTLLVQRTKAGKAMRATAQDRDASAMMGINVDRTISFTFALGGALAGAAGVIYALYIGTSNFQLGFRLGLFAFTAAVLGGIGNIPGAVLGGLLIGLIRAYGTAYVGERWTSALVFAVLIVILVFRPSGLLGSRVREKV